MSASVDEREISSQFAIVATAKPGGDLAKIEKDIDQEPARLLAQGPTPKELDRAEAGRIAGFARGLERIGSFGSKSDILALNQTYRGDPGYYQTVLKYEREAATGDLRNAARKWLTENVYALEVTPFPEYETAASGADRSKLPASGAPPEVKFPALQRASLANGLKIVLAERHSLPLVEFTLQVNAGREDSSEPRRGLRQNQR